MIDVGDARRGPLESHPPASMAEGDSRPRPQGLRPGVLGRLHQWVVLIRVRQWAKNCFVLAPLLFSMSALDPAAVGLSLLAFAAFCAISSAVYVFNDLLDRDADRLHPRKCLRPLASGRVSVAEALVLCVGLLGAGLAVGLLLPPAFLSFAGLYLANSLLYCLFLKHKVIADVMSIAAGFVVRIFAGCAALGVVPSSWIVVCGFSLAMALGFGKRRAEVAQIGSRVDVRPALESYDIPKLDMLLAISTAVALVAYMLYTVSPDTERVHHTKNLIYSVPLVAYGLFRYLFKSQEGGGDGPTEILLGDRVFPLVGVMWGVTVAVILYWGRGAP